MKKLLFGAALLISAGTAMAGTLSINLSQSAFVLVAVGNGATGTTLLSNNSLFFCVTSAATLPAPNDPCVISGGSSTKDEGIQMFTTANIYARAVSSSGSVIKVVTP